MRRGGTSESSFLGSPPLGMDEGSADQRVHGTAAKRQWAVMADGFGRTIVRLRHVCMLQVLRDAHGEPGS